MNYFKKSIKNTLSKLKKDNWEENRKYKMLIRTTDYFTRDKWLNNIHKILQNDVDNYEIIFTKNKLTFYKLAQNADTIFAFSINSEIVNNNKSLRLYYLGLRGTDTISDNDLPKTFKFHNAPPLGKRFIAEFVLMVSFILCRRFQYSFYNQVEKKWNQNNMLDGGVSSITDKVVGIAGVGNIGSEIAKLFSSIGCSVVGWDKSVEIISNSFRRIYKSSEMDLFLGSIDILIISLPLTMETFNLFDNDKLSKLKKGSFLINISRGSIVNENDLIDALEAKQLGGAALDVFVNEPLPRNNKLWNFENVLISPHIAGNINYFVDEIQIDYLEKVKKEFSG